MNITSDQKRAVLKDVDLSDAQQVFDAVAAALIASSGGALQPVAWARPDELDRLADPQIDGRTCYLGKQHKERCTVALYAGAPAAHSADLLWAAVRNALAAARHAASQLEDVQFRSGMESACDEIESRLSSLQQR